MRLRDKQIGTRHARTESRPSDANREDILDPSLVRVGSLEPVAGDPLNGARPAEDGRQQITYGEVFNLLIAICSPDLRAL